MILSLVLPLIPTSISKADSGYSAETSFHYTYDGYQYYFYTDGSDPLPRGYRFQDDALEAVIENSASYINLNISSVIGSKINFILSNFVSKIFDVVRNFSIIEMQYIASWLDNSVFGWNFTFTGTDENYANHDIYGTAYGWHFEGALLCNIDLVLDSNGNLYGSNPIGNAIGSDGLDDFNQWSIHQFDGNDIWWEPENTTPSYQNLAQPYIQGSSLFFTLYYNGSPFRFELENFTDTFIGVQYLGFGNKNFLFYSPSHAASTFVLNNIDNYPTASWSTPTGNLSGVDTGWGQYGKLSFSGSYPDSFILPNLYSETPSTAYFTMNKTVTSLGFNQSNNISGTYNRIYLNGVSTTPLPNPISVPADDPIPLSDLDPDPSDFVPSADPDPVPGIDYPEPEPTPVPLPPIPSVVSGNDDLWPDLNDYFETEDNIIDFTFPAVNVEFPDLSVLLGNFVNSFTWVSTIITALFNGSDFSVLFSVLAFFFIAAAVLGIYKWWK